MPPASKCPSEIFRWSVEEKVTYFAKSVIVDHPMLTSSLDYLDQKANPLFERRLILLVGGTGVGKTALMHKLVEQRNIAKAAETQRDKQLVPAFFIEIDAPDNGPFKFSSLYRNALVEIGAALADRSIRHVARGAGEKQVITLAVEEAGRRVNADALKDRFMTNLIDRKIEIACFDEAINLFKVGRARTEKERLANLKDQADKLKTFTNKTPTSIVLSGAYDFFELTLSSGQLARRSQIVHMTPYLMDDKGLSGFVVALLELIAHLPTEHGLDAKETATELFLQCLGCVGILKNILTGGLLLALKKNEPLTIKFLRLAYFTKAQLDVMRKEMEGGIRAVNELTTMAQLANKAVQSTEVVAMASKHKLRPGETTPSHRKDATKGWGKP